MTVSNKTMERIMRQDSNLSPYDEFRIGGIGRVLNQIGLNQRRHHIIYKVSSGEFFIPMELTRNVIEMQLIPKEEILEELSKLREEVVVTMKWIHIGAIEVVIKATFKEGIDSEIHLSIMDRRINNLRDGCLGTMIENLKENGSMTLGLNFLEDYKPWGRKGSGICTAKPGVFPKEAMKTLPVIARRDFSQKILILNKDIREAKIMIGGALDHPALGQQGLIESDSFYEESEKEIINLKEALQEIKSLDISEESRLSLENVKRLIQRTLGIIKEHINLGFIEPGVSAYSSPGFLIKMESESKKFTAFSTPQGQYIWNVMPMGLANAPQIFQRKMDNLFKDYFEFMFVYIDDILIASKNMKDHIQHLEIFFDACYREGLVFFEKKTTIAVNKIEFLGILIDKTGSCEYRKDFRPLLKETESSKWKWEEIHTQRVRELKHVCSNLPKLVIPQDEDELVVYTDANDYRWEAVLMKRTTIGEEPCRYTGGLFTTTKGISMRKNSLQCGMHLRNGPYFYLLKSLH
ncbi:UNVERIFIED_CONTAM: Enzymatic polyprotein [Sesamum latifolium]|uniref:Enzymatic polyprotein n=1 Tax=Sesamum latifolium TaxID=2727402 RepID=A0AAW2SRN3_9LAMI